MTDTERSRYRHWHRELLRFADLDLLGHVNNIAFLIFFEGARVSFLSTCGQSPTAPTDGKNMVIRKQITDFLAQLHYPGTVEVGTRVTRIGRSSFTMAHALFGQDGTCCATAEDTCVFIDMVTGRPVPIPEDIRARMLEFADPAPAEG